MFCQSMVEEAGVDWFRARGYSVEGGLDMSPGTEWARYPLRATHAHVVRTNAVRGPSRRVNAEPPEEPVADTLRKLTRTDGATLKGSNRASHCLAVDGVGVEYVACDGPISGAHARVIDFGESDANTWSAINRFTVTENGKARRSDIVVFVNAPLAVIELKTRDDESAIVWSMFQQLHAYNAELPSLFACNAAPETPDGMQQRLLRLSAGREWFKPLHTIGVQVLVPAYTELRVTIEGIFVGEFA